MDKLPETDDGWDRMLAQGGLPGPEADAMWEKIHARVAPQPSWQQRLARLWFVLPLPIAAVAVLLLMPGTPDPNDGFIERGDDVTMLEATCGEKAACVVGQPIFLRMLHPTGGTLYVAMKDAKGTASLIAGPVTLRRGSMPLSVKLVPDAGDVDAGITLHWWVRPAPLPPGDVEKLVKEPASSDGTLRLRVSAQ